LIFAIASIAAVQRADSAPRDRVGHDTKETPERMASLHPNKLDKGEPANHDPSRGTQAKPEPKTGAARSQSEPARAELETGEAVAVLGEAYRGVTEMLDGLAERDFLRPTRCLGWSVADCLYHLLGDARRALTALATPAMTDPDVDFVSYWKPWQPDGDDSLTRTRAYRLAAAAVSAVTGPVILVEAWRETASAAVRLAGLAPYPVVATQGHALTVADFAATLAIEASVHHLDMIAELPAAPAPTSRCLSLVRRALDGLIGEPVAAEWDDATYALKGTGRSPLTPADRTHLGPQAARFPLFG
jgi:hypothetical protein